MSLNAMTVVARRKQQQAEYRETVNVTPLGTTLDYAGAWDTNAIISGPHKAKNGKKYLRLEDAAGNRESIFLSNNLTPIDQAKPFTYLELLMMPMYATEVDERDKETKEKTGRRIILVSIGKIAEPADEKGVTKMSVAEVVAHLAAKAEEKQAAPGAA